MQRVVFFGAFLPLSCLQHLVSWCSRPVSWCFFAPILFAACGFLVLSAFLGALGPFLGAFLPLSWLERVVSWRSRPVSWCFFAPILFAACGFVVLSARFLVLFCPYPVCSVWFLGARGPFLGAFFPLSCLQRVVSWCSRPVSWCFFAPVLFAACGFLVLAARFLLLFCPYPVCSVWFLGALGPFLGAFLPLSCLQRVVSWCSRPVSWCFFAPILFAAWCSWPLSSCFCAPILIASCGFLVLSARFLVLFCPYPVCSVWFLGVLGPFLGAFLPLSCLQRVVSCYSRPVSWCFFAPILFAACGFLVLSARFLVLFCPYPVCSVWFLGALGAFLGVFLPLSCLQRVVFWCSRPVSSCFFAPILFAACGFLVLSARFLVLCCPYPVCSVWFLGALGPFLGAFLPLSCLQRVVSWCSRPISWCFFAPILFAACGFLVLSARFLVLFCPYLVCSVWFLGALGPFLGAFLPLSCLQRVVSW